MNLVFGVAFDAVAIDCLTDRGISHVNSPCEVERARIGAVVSDAVTSSVPAITQGYVAGIRALLVLRRHMADSVVEDFKPVEAGRSKSRLSRSPLDPLP